MQPSSVRTVASSAGLSERFRYWIGLSGRRYLFTETSAPLIGDFEEAVAIGVADHRVVWAGSAAEAASFPVSARIRACRLFVHLLASSDAERQAIIADLSPTRPVLALAA